MPRLAYMIIHIKIAEELGISVRFIPDWNLHKLCYNPEIGRFQVEGFLGMPTMCLSTTPSGNGELQLKNVLDFCIHFIYFD